MKRVLVTGCKGFTGQYLTSRLRADGAEVFGVVQAEAGSGEIGADLRDDAAIRKAVSLVKPTHVLHLAAISFVAHGDSRAFYDVNVFGTLNLLEALGECAPTPARVVIASSANVYGTPAVETIDETVCPLPVNHYGNSKLAMEHMVRTWMGRLPIVIARPFNYTGVGQDERFLIPKIVGNLRRRAPVLELGNLDVARDFSDVRDVAEAYARLLDADAAVGKVVNVCSGAARSLRAILHAAFDIAGFAPEVVVDPALVRTNEVPRLAGDYGRLLSLTGFRPTIPIDDTLRWMLGS